MDGGRSVSRKAERGRVIASAAANAVICRRNRIISGPMCLIAIAHNASPKFPLVIAANRDELYARPTRPAHVWEDDPRVIGGRDLDRLLQSARTAAESAAQRAADCPSFEFDAAAYLERGGFLDELKACAEMIRRWSTHDRSTATITPAFTFSSETARSCIARTPASSARSMACSRSATRRLACTGRKSIWRAPVCRRCDFASQQRRRTRGRSVAIPVDIAQRGNRRRSLCYFGDIRHAFIDGDRRRSLHRTKLRT